MLSAPFLTTQEVAELLRVREQTVRSWIHAQELRAVKLGREFRVAVKDLEAFVNEHATCDPGRDNGGGCA
ncbi:helix-turn-helix domain-containing protein [Aestuariivita sp.]|jgi:excisionase family DNA binding protein|uniref:helix-turn-helix domain-containing protein n=1 Tax=Aestuariivita sp. TaxID=1872407 RepID=UPI00216CC30F|nr:helix-turn-helix domain-containing protein [Aestuariivita sp.]MCE8005857.1 helix-turn-helix domain-containing protein [Aestuariivita sp.]